MKNQAPMSYTDAAEKVLQELAKGKPMHYMDIVNIAISKGWLVTQGLTPGTTMTASIGEENRRRDAKSKTPRFFAAGKGFYGLTEWSQSPAAKAADKASELNRQQMKKELVSYLQTISPPRLEEVVAELLIRIGYVNVQHVGGVGDGGVDVEAELPAFGTGTFKVIIQVKRYKGGVNISADPIKVLAASYHSKGDTDLYIFVTTSDYTQTAYKYVAEKGKERIVLITGDGLADLLIENQLGVVERRTPSYILDKNYFEPPVVSALAQQPEPEVVQPSITAASSSSGKPTSIIPKGLALTAKLKGGKIVEGIAGDNDHVIYDGVEYSSPSQAGVKATGWKTCNGWVFWSYQDPETGEWALLDTLRNKD